MSEVGGIFVVGVGRAYTLGKQREHFLAASAQARHFVAILNPEQRHSRGNRGVEDVADGGARLSGLDGKDCALGDSGAVRQFAGGPAKRPTGFANLVAEDSQRIGGLWSKIYGPLKPYRNKR